MGEGENDGLAIRGAACLSCCVIIFVLGLIALGIAEIVIGAIYIHDCSIEKMVPIYLIVSGIAPVLFGGFGKSNEEDSGLTAGAICGFIGFLCNIAWLICGTIWIYPTYSTLHKDTYVPCHSVYGTIGPQGCTDGTCKDTLINFAFAMVTIDWICMCMWIVVLGCTVVRMCK